MIVGKVLTATLALALSIALLPLSELQAAPLSGSHAQMPSLITTIAMKHHKRMHHGMRHHRHHRMHSRRGKCGTYMYYSRKKHRCMDARSK
jgi:hypothetical protein